MNKSTTCPHCKTRNRLRERAYCQPCERERARKRRQREKLRPVVRTMSPRRVQALQLMWQGMPTKVMAYQMGICESTAKQVRSALMKISGSKNAFQLGVWAQRNGYVQDPEPQAQVNVFESNRVSA